jgi:hypothetical protein
MMSKRVKMFRQMNAAAGTVMTPKEAKANYLACMSALLAVQECGYKIDAAVDMIEGFDTIIHPGLVRKFLTEAMELL